MFGHFSIFLIFLFAGVVGATGPQYPINCGLSYNVDQIRAQCVQTQNTRTLANLNQSLLRRACRVGTQDSYQTSDPDNQVCTDLFASACNVVPTPDSDCNLPLYGNENANGSGNSLSGYGASIQALMTEAATICSANRQKANYCRDYNACSTDHCRRRHAIRGMTFFDDNRMTGVEGNPRYAPVLETARAWNQARRNHADRVGNMVYGSGTGSGAGNSQYQRAREAFEEAQEYMRMAVLNRQDPPLTRAHKDKMIANINNTIFPSPERYKEYYMNGTLDEGCYSGGEGHGGARRLYMNAVNLRHTNIDGNTSMMDANAPAGSTPLNPRGTVRNMIIPCAGYLHSNQPKMNLIHMFAHELGHSIGPCQMEVESVVGHATHHAHQRREQGRSVPNRICQNISERRSIDRSGPRPRYVRQYNDFYRGASANTPRFRGVFDNLKSCLRSNEGARAQEGDAGACYSTQNPIYKCAASDTPSCNNIRRQGLDAHCQRDMQDDQIEESTADWFAAKAVAFAMKDYVAKEKTTPAMRTLSDTRNVIKNLAATNCRSERSRVCRNGSYRGPATPDSFLRDRHGHPPGYIRTNFILGADPEIRRLLGCRKNPEPVPLNVYETTTQERRKICTFSGN